MRNAAASGPSHGDADPESESDSDPDSKRCIKELLARMIHDQRVGSPSDTDDESESSEEERTAYSEGLHNINEGRRSEVSNKNVIYTNNDIQNSYKIHTKTVHTSYFVHTL